MCRSTKYTAALNSSGNLMGGAHVIGIEAISQFYRGFSDRREACSLRPSSTLADFPSCTFVSLVVKGLLPNLIPCSPTRYDPSARRPENHNDLHDALAAKDRLGSRIGTAKKNGVPIKARRRTF